MRRLACVCFFIIAIIILPKNILANEVNINFGNYLELRQSFGIKIPSSLSNALIQEIINYFPRENIYLKIENPNNGLLDNNNFKWLNSKGFKWYFSFTENDGVQLFLSSYFSKYSKEAVVELNFYDPNLIKSLKSTYPKIKIHCCGFIFWPRNEVKEVLEQTPPPNIEAISLKTEERELNFDNFRLMFDTFYDAVFDVPAESGIKINFPNNTTISLSDHVIKEGVVDAQSIAFETGIISSAVVTATQTKYDPVTAPTMYLISGNFFQKSDNGKMITKYLSDFVNQKPLLVWPGAKFGDGGPFNKYKPVVGMIGKIDTGYYIIFTNTENSPVTAVINANINLNNYQLFSSIRGKNKRVTDSNRIYLDAYETVVAAPSLDQLNNIIIPTETPIPTSRPVPTIIKNPESKRPVPTIIKNPESKVQPVPTVSTNVTFLITINNPYTPYRTITEALFEVENNHISLYKGQTSFSLTLFNKSTKYKLTVKTDDNFTFVKEGWINFEKENKIVITTGNFFFVSINRLINILFNRIDDVKKILEFLDRPFKVKEFKKVTNLSRL
jgi:hypothetical protein